MEIYAIPLGIGVVVLLIIFYRLYKFKGPKVSWTLFSFVFANIAIQVSAFLVLPLDIVKVNSEVKTRRKSRETSIY